MYRYHGIGTALQTGLLATVGPHGVVDWRRPYDHQVCFPLSPSVLPNTNLYSNIGHDVQALWKHFDESVTNDFIAHRQLWHVSIISLCSFLGRLSRHRLRSYCQAPPSFKILVRRRLRHHLLTRSSRRYPRRRSKFPVGCIRTLRTRIWRLIRCLPRIGCRRFWP